MSVETGETMIHLSYDLGYRLLTKLQDCTDEMGPAQSPELEALIKELQQLVIEQCQDPAITCSYSRSAKDGGSTKRRQVALLLAKGNSTAEVARILGISVSTVRSHARTNASEKAG